MTAMMTMIALMRLMIMVSLLVMTTVTEDAEGAGDDSDPIDCGP